MRVRQSVGPDTGDQRFIELVGTLSLASPRFRDLWNRHDAGAQRGASVRIDHPQVGEMALHRERLGISGTDGMTLVMYHAEPGSADAEKLALLASSVLEPADGIGPDRRSPIRRPAAGSRATRLAPIRGFRPRHRPGLADSTLAQRKIGFFDPVKLSRRVERRE